MKNNDLDIYFNENYGKLYETVENGKAIVYKLKTKDGIIHNQFIKREIPIELNDNNKYYDITTPYGYGGPVIIECNGDKNKLLKDYEENFKNYCYENNIISEFIRFHPIINNALDFKSTYNPECIRKTLGTNLEIYEDPIHEEFTKSCRKSIRQALNKGITYNINECPENLDDFKKIYYLTMDRKSAQEYYYFPDNYFENILNNFKDNIVVTEAIYNGKVIASGLYFVYNEFIHTHLSGTDTNYIKLAPSYILRYGTVLWGKKHGYKLIHHGGGLSNSEEDSLYKFKRQFSKNTDFDFYIGKKIWNQNIYNEMCKIKNVNNESDFFPAYRKKI